MSRRPFESLTSGGTASSSPAGDRAGPLRFTVADGYRIIMSALMVVLGVVILVRTLTFGFHLTAVLVGLGFVALGGYRLSFVVAYIRRARSR